MKPKRSHTATGCPCCQEPDNQNAKKNKRRKTAETTTEAEQILPTSSRKLSLSSSTLPNLKLQTPVQLLSPYIHGYMWQQYLIDGFTYGFRLGYTGPRISSSSPNLKSCVDDPATVHDKLHQELQAHIVRGPFCQPPFPNLKVSPIGLVPKKTPGEFRLIHHLSFP